MCTMDELELAAIDPRRLNPVEQSALRARLLRRAQEARAQALRDIARGIWTTLRGTVTRAWSAWRSWRAHRAAVRELYALDDRMLRDIGLGRSEIESIVNDSERLLARELSAMRYQLRAASPKPGVATPKPNRCLSVARPAPVRPLNKTAA